MEQEEAIAKLKEMVAQIHPDVLRLSLQVSNLEAFAAINNLSISWDTGDVTPAE